jgi:biotin-(acetyl-CoA carboxylase) ligase
MPVAIRDVTRRDLVLPSLYTLHTLRESGDAFAHAQAIAATEGAGTLVWVRRFDLVEFALVLEPQEPLVHARNAFYACMNALADALATLCPPEKPVTFAWPGSLLFDAGVIGGGRLAWPDGAAEDAPPDWLVFGAMLRVADAMSTEPGLRTLGVAMEDEGFEDFDAGDFVESFARHLMSAFHDWSEKGPKTVLRRWLDRLERDGGKARFGIDANADLLVREGTRVVERRDFIAANAAPAWFDPENGAPRL